MAAHSHAHSHSQPRRADPPALSLLRLSVAERLIVVALALGALWAAVLATIL
jgi:hypothetical protein